MCVQAAVEYAKTIDDFDDLVDPRTLARHCFGLEPSSFVLRAIEIEENSDLFIYLFLFYLFFIFYLIAEILIFHLLTEMKTKFNEELYAKMRARKNEPLSSLGKKVVRVVEKGTLITLLTLSLKP